MKAEYLTSGYYTMANGEYVKHHNTIEEAREHIKFQTEEFNSTAKWKIVKVNIKTEIVE